MADKERVSCERVGLEYFDHAPVNVTVSEVVAATPEQVFASFLDADSWSQWAFPILEVEWTSPFPLEVGSTRTVRMRGGMVGWEEFLAWEPNTHMAFRFNETIKGGPIAFAEDYVVTDLGGSCRVAWTMAMTLPGLSGRMSPVIAASMRVANRRMLRRFARYVASSQ